MWERIFAGWLVIAAVTFGVAGIALLLVPLGWFAHFGWPLEACLAWDAGLSLLFFVQHSGMVRRPVRRVLHIPEPYWPSFYAACSGLALMIVCFLWQRAGAPLFSFGFVLRIASWICVGAAVLVFVTGARALHEFDILGVRAVRTHLGGVKRPSSELIVRGPYRWVRHPLYSAILILFWTAPDPTADRLLFDILWTIWIVIAVRWEERDLIADFGPPYRRYRDSVPALVPWHAPRRS